MSVTPIDTKLRRLWLFALILVCLALPGQAKPAVEKSIKSVEIKIQPGEGVAFCVYDAKGKVHGGHASGGPQPFVHEDDGQVSQEVVTAIWALAGDLVTRHVVSGPVVWSKASYGKTHIVIRLVDDKELAVSWPFKGQHPDEKVRRLADLLNKHHVGGW